jgi:excisionase family DNA binding protein
MLKTIPGEIAHSLALSVNEACTLSSLGRTTFYKYLKNGKLPAHKCGSRTVVLRDELEQALKCLPRAGMAS